MEKVTRFFARLANWQYFALTVLVLASVVLHIAVITNPNETIFDEAHYVADGRRILNGEGTERIEHPPVGKIFIVAGMELFGDNPWGWRMPSILFGSIGLVLFYGICRLLGGSQRLAFIAAFLLTFENLSFIHAGMAMLDEFTAFFTIFAFWLYLKGLQQSSKRFNQWWFFMAIAIAMSALSKLSGVLTVVPIGLHWLISGYKKFQRPAADKPAAVVRKGLFSHIVGFFHDYVYSLPFVPYALLAPVFFLGLMAVFDWIIWQRWINPFEQLLYMSSLTNGIKFTGYTAPPPSRPWEWLLSPTNSFSLYKWMFSGGKTEIQILGYDWPPYGPHITGMTSPTIWFLSLLAIPYVIWRSFKKDEAALFALCWIIGTWLLWVPLSLLTDRVSFSFYYIPTIPALCLGGALLVNKGLDFGISREGRDFQGFIKALLGILLFLHLVFFCLLGPDKLSISISASILVLAFSLDYLGFSWQTTLSAVAAITLGILGLRYVLYRYLEMWFGTDTIVGLYPASFSFWAVGIVVTLAFIGLVFWSLRGAVLKKEELQRLALPSKIALS